MKDSTKALAAVCLAAMMFGLEISSIPVILPTLETLLDTRFSDLQWIMNAYTLACTSVLMAVGTLVDRYGRKALFILSVAVFGLASLACGLAENATLLIAARAVQGASGGAMLVCQISILSRQFTEARARGKAFGLWGIIFGAGLGLGPIIGAGILALANWQWVFLVHVPLAVIACALAVSGVQASREAHGGKLDGLGILLLAAAVFGLSYLIIQGPQPGMSRSSLGVIGVLTLLALVAFVISQQRNPQPMMDFSVFRIRGFSGALLGSAGMNFSFWPLMIYLPLYVQAGMGLGNGEAGVLLLAYTLPTLFVPPLGERLALKLHPGVLIPAGLLVIGAGLTLMCVAIGLGELRVPGMVLGCLLAGTGLGLTNTPVTNTSTGAVPQERAGMASGMDMSARMISLAINIAVMGWVLVQGIGSGLRDALPASLDAAALHAAAQAVAAGRQEVPAAAFHAALDLGFSWVLLYGVASVCLAALASLMVFRPWAADRVPLPPLQTGSANC